MEKKETIWRAALKLLVEKGLHAVPMSAIAKAADTGMGTIYNYFESKEALINAIYVAIKQEEAAALSTTMPDQPIKTQFEHYYRQGVGFFIENPLYFKFMEQMQASPLITEAAREAGYQAIAPVVALLEQGQSERVVKPFPIDELLQFLGGTVLSYLRWYHGQDRAGQPGALENQLAMTWDGLQE